jgi:hypothetical protein
MNSFRKQEILGFVGIGVAEFAVRRFIDVPMPVAVGAVGGLVALLLWGLIRERAIMCRWKADGRQSAVDAFNRDRNTR